MNGVGVEFKVGNHLKMIWMKNGVSNTFIVIKREFNEITRISLSKYFYTGDVSYFKIHGY